MMDVGSQIGELEDVTINKLKIIFLTKQKLEPEFLISTYITQGPHIGKKSSP